MAKYQSFKNYYITNLQSGRIFCALLIGNHTPPRSPVGGNHSKSRTDAAEIPHNAQLGLVNLSLTLPNLGPQRGGNEDGDRLREMRTKGGGNPENPVGLLNGRPLIE